MSFRIKLFLFIFSIILLITLVILWINTEKKSYQPGISTEFDQAANQAQFIYRETKKTGIDLKNGPCLTNALMPGWVADLVHNPRTKVDDLPENQCSAYLQGNAKHFVELDLEGNVVRVH
ncbi:hypothetical protein HY025_04330 [Candidatus Daviesbacteria bacterium]|nr:hypothetical protein [Candidatus Daviesbacteria bacterium]